MRKPALAEIEVLFPDQPTTNPFEVFVRELQGRDREGRRRARKVNIDFGSYVSKEEIQLLPWKELRSFEGTELAAAIIDIYNKEYWLLAFWMKLLENAGNSYIGREIVRALIKHCIYVTAEELISHNRQIDSRFIHTHGLTNRVTYYKLMFNWAAVYQCIREDAKRKIENRFRAKSSSAFGFEIKRGFTDVAERLPEINKVLNYSNLPEIVGTSREQAENLGGISQFIFLTSYFWRDSRRLRRELRRLLKEQK